MMSFANKVVIVTGASAGIGAATAIQFAKEGADVVLVARNEANLAKVKEECAKYGKKPLVIKADVSKDEEAKTIVASTIKTFGKLDVLVNNAGTFFPDDILKSEYMQTFDAIMVTNLRAVAFLTNLVAPHLIETKGNIVNVSSIDASMVKYPKFSAYFASKAAVNHFTRCIALELAPFGVRVNTVSPGPVNTEILDKVGLGALMPELKTTTALNQISEPEEIAELILFMASEKAKSITGSDYKCDNGIILK